VSKVRTDPNLLPHNLQKHITVAGHTQYSPYDERTRKYADYWDANANVPNRGIGVSQQILTDKPLGM
jgi:hypothetical protein